jgi:diamine N-acetyltransferase
VKPDNKYVGNIAMQDFDPVHRRMELGIVIGVSEARGHGIGKQACSLMVKYAFEHLNVHKITAGTVTENVSMDKVFRSLGFKVEGRLLQHWFVEGKYHDIYRYGLLGQDFKPVF